jgi:ATP-binding cassette subfamily B protein/subfamily B ATP-binding cassette protein MsbA
LLIVLLTMALGIAVDVLHPWPLKLLIDQILGQQPLPEALQHAFASLPGPHDRGGLLTWVAVSTIALFLLSTLLSIWHTLAEVSLGQRLTYDLGADLFRHLQRLSLVFHSRQEVGDTTVRVTEDAYCVSELVTGALLPLLQATVTLLTIFAIMWQLEPRMTLLAVGIIPAQVIVMQLFGRPLKARTRERRDLEGHMTSVVQQALNAIPAVQAFTREDMEHARFRRFAQATLRAYLRQTSFNMWFKLFAGLVTALSTAGIIYLGARYAMEGHVSVGTIVLFLTYLASLSGPLNNLTDMASTLRYAAASGDRVMEILEVPADVRDLPNARTVQVRGHIRYQHVFFGYEPNHPVLKDISFEVRPGDVVAIVGPTGAGKTTLVNLLVRFFDPWSGQVTMDGEDLRQLRVRSLRQQVAIVLQEPFIFPYTVAENIAYGRPEATRKDIIAAAVAANADAFIRRLPEGYDTEVGERGATLSGGERQRLSIARAFLKDAPVLILDEPTSALDARTESFLLEALERLMQGRTTFIIAHRLSTIRNADRILVIDQGEIVEDGRHRDLVAANGLYATLYQHQTEITRHEALPLEDVVPVADPTSGVRR